jgi:hypothetical protein
LGLLFQAISLNYFHIAEKKRRKSTKHTTQGNEKTYPISFFFFHLGAFAAHVTAFPVSTGNTGHVSSNSPSFFLLSINPGLVLFSLSVQVHISIDVLEVPPYYIEFYILSRERDTERGW